MTPMNKYNLIRILSGYVLLVSGFIFNDFYFLIGSLICLLFSTQYEDEDDCFPEITKHSHERIFYEQMRGLSFILLSIILYRFPYQVSYVTMPLGIYYSSYHKNLYFYRKDAVLVSGVYTIEEVNKMGGDA